MKFVDVTQNKNYLSRHKILDTETNEQVVKNLEFNFIELKKFTKTSQELTSIIDQWVYFIKNAENLDVIPETITDDGIQDAFGDANKHNWTKEGLEEYNKIFIREQDERGRLELAERRRSLEIAKNAKAMGLKNEDIVKLTGLTKDEIDQL